MPSRLAAAQTAANPSQDCSLLLIVQPLLNKPFFKFQNFLEGSYFSAMYQNRHITNNDFTVLTMQPNLSNVTDLHY